MLFLLWGQCALQTCVKTSNFPEYWYTSFYFLLVNMTQYKRWNTTMQWQNKEGSSELVFPKLHTKFYTFACLVLHVYCWITRNKHRLLDLVLHVWFYVHPLFKCQNRIIKWDLKSGRHFSSLYSSSAGWGNQKNTPGLCWVCKWCWKKRRVSRLERAP